MRAKHIGQFLREARVDPKLLRCGPFNESTVRKRLTARSSLGGAFQYGEYFPGLAFKHVRAKNVDEFPSLAAELVEPIGQFLCINVASQKESFGRKHQGHVFPFHHNRYWA